MAKCDVKKHYFAIHNSVQLTTTTADIYAFDIKQSQQTDLRCVHFDLKYAILT